MRTFVEKNVRQSRGVCRSYPQIEPPFENTLFVEVEIEAEICSAHTGSARFAAIQSRETKPIVKTTSHQNRITGYDETRSLNNQCEYERWNVSIHTS